MFMVVEVASTYGKNPRNATTSAAVQRARLRAVAQYGSHCTK
ncbi:MAG: hypothetical protein RL685_1609 [Pseudomonadota bacterium]|jgi:hypothetical protein